MASYDLCAQALSGSDDEKSIVRDIRDPVSTVILVEINTKVFGIKRSKSPKKDRWKARIHDISRADECN